MNRSSIALVNLRAVVILIVLAFQSVLPYLASLPPAPYSFDSPLASASSDPVRFLIVLATISALAHAAMALVIAAPASGHDHRRSSPRMSQHRR
jgi:hypothetical protein